MINVKTVKQNWFKFLLFLLLILRIFLIFYEFQHDAFMVDHKNPYLFLKKAKTLNTDGIDLSSRSMKIYFPKIFSFFLNKNKSKELPSISSFQLLSYGNVTNEFVIEILEAKENKKSLKNVKQKLSKLLKQNSVKDSLEVSVSYKEENYRFYIGKTKGYTLFTNILNNRQNPKNLLLDIVSISNSSYYGIEISLFLLALVFLSFSTKIRSLETKIERLIYALIVLHLVPTFYIKAHCISLVNIGLEHVLMITTLSLINLIILNIHKKSKLNIKILEFITLICPFLVIVFPNLSLILHTFLLFMFFYTFTAQKKAMSKFRKIVYKKWDNLGIIPFVRIVLLFMELFIVNNLVYPYIEINQIQELNHFTIYIFVMLIVCAGATLSLIPATIFSIDLKKYIDIQKGFYFFSTISIIISLIWLICFPLNISPNIVLIFLLSFLIPKFLFSKYKLFEPIKFDTKKELSTYLSDAFRQLTTKELYQDTEYFLTEKFKSVDCAYISGETKFGYDFKEQFRATDLVPYEQNYFNLDIERSNISEDSINFPEEPNEDEIKLFFPIRNNKNIRSFFLFGSSSKLFWIKEEVDFIFEIIKIFQNALDTVHLNVQFREKQIAFEKEQEEKRIQKLYASELENKNVQIYEEKKKLTDSIAYAALIQNSILPREEEISQYIKNYFIVWKPRDIVSGDFYWFFPIPKSKNYIISVIDCTGHGVPGAFMSMTANSILNNIVREKKIYEVDKILNLLHKEIRYTLRQQSKESQQDGMDISLCYIDVNLQEIHFSGAMQFILLIKSNQSEIERIRGNRFSIGGRQKEKERIFTKQVIPYNSGDSIYLMSDGLADQKVRINGEKTKFKIKRVKEMFLKYNPLPIIERKIKIEEELVKLQDDIEQRDDIVVVGVKL